MPIGVSSDRCYSSNADLVVNTAELPETAAFGQALDAMGSKAQSSVACIAGEPEPVTEEERQLQHENLYGLGQNRAAFAAFGFLINSKDFQNLNSGGRVALLRQVQNYPDARSITNLRLLAKASWFRTAPLENQQRTAKLVAFASQYPDGDTALLNNTIRSILTGNFRVEWDPELSGTLNYGSFGNKNGNRIALNPDFVTAGNGPLIQTDDAIHLCTNTIPHEFNHYLTGGKVEETYRYFMDEYRAWYVGYQAQHKHPPSQKECYGRAIQLVKAKEDAYGYIGRAFRSDSAESKKIVHFMAQLIGYTGHQLDHASRHSVLHPTKPLSNDIPGRLPEKASDDDPNNLDNHETPIS